MTKQELIDYCFMYWQHVSKKMLDLMKDYPCVYIDNRLYLHSLTYGMDTDVMCDLRISPDENDVHIYSLGYKFHYDYVSDDKHTYKYEEIEDRLMDRFMGIVLYIANNEHRIMERMREEVNLINYIKKAVGK